MNLEQRWQHKKDQSKKHITQLLLMRQHRFLAVQRLCGPFRRSTRSSRHMHHNSKTHFFFTTGYQRGLTHKYTRACTDPQRKGIHAHRQGPARAKEDRVGLPEPRPRDAEVQRVSRQAERPHRYAATDPPAATACSGIGTHPRDISWAGLCVDF